MDRHRSGIQRSSWQAQEIAFEKNQTKSKRQWTGMEPNHPINPESQQRFSRETIDIEGIQNRFSQTTQLLAMESRGTTGIPGLPANFTATTDASLSNFARGDPGGYYSTVNLR